MILPNNKHSDMKNKDNFLEEQILCLNKILSKKDHILKIKDILIKSREQGSKIFVMGNGGSGSTASHFVSDLLKTALIKNKNRFSAFSLVDNMPVILAWANDTSYDEIFVEQLKNSFRKKDVLIGFSGSGKSKNVIKAFEFAKKNGGICIGFTGMDGGKFPSKTDVCFVVPNNDMLLIESTHVILCHHIISLIRQNGKPVFTYT